MPIKLNLKIYQGGTFKETLRWESSTKKYVSITNISNTAPMTITTAPAIIFPAGWRFKVTNVTGMTEANCDADAYYIATSITPSGGNNIITVNSVNSSGFKAFVSGGVVEYNDPVDLTGFTASMQIKDKVGGVEMLSLTTANSGVAINTSLNTITINITAAQTALLDFSTAVYDLELVSAGGEVTKFASGSLSLVKEVTTI